MASAQLLPNLPEKGIYHYNTVTSEPWYNTLFAVPLFSRALAAGLFTYDPSVTSLVTIDKVYEDGTLMWTDSSNWTQNPQRKWAFTFHLFGVSDDNNPDIIYNAVHVFNRLYKHLHPYSAEIEGQNFSDAVIADLQKLPKDIHTADLRLANQILRKDSQREVRTVLEGLPNRPIIHRTTKTKKLGSTRAQIKNEITMQQLQEQLQLAFQTIDALTKRVEQLEHVERPLSTQPSDYTAKSLIIPVLQSMDTIKEKPNSNQRRKADKKRDTNANISNPNNPGYLGPRAPKPNLQPTKRPRYPKDPQPGDRNYVAPHDDPTSRRDPLLHPWQQVTRKYPKPKPEKCLNPKYTDTDPKQQKIFFENKIHTLNQSLRTIPLLPNISKLEDKVEPLMIFNPLTKQKEVKYTSPFERLQRKRNAIRRARLKAYKALECLGYTHYSHNARVNRNAQFTPKRGPPASQPYGSKSQPLPPARNANRFSPLIKPTLPVPDSRASTSMSLANTEYDDDN